jgi:hypothetical protein
MKYYTVTNRIERLTFGRVFDAVHFSRNQARRRNWPDMVDLWHVIERKLQRLEQNDVDFSEDELMHLYNILDARSSCYDESDPQFTYYETWKHVFTGVAWRSGTR